MRPPSYYNTLANANPTTSNRGSTRQQLRSSFANSSSASYATSSHLPFVSQSMLVAHCYTGAGSTTKPYGYQQQLQYSASPTGFSSAAAANLYSSPASYSSSYTRPSSSSSRRPQLQHQSSFSGSSYSSGGAAPAGSSGSSYFRAPSPRSSYLSSTTLASLSSPHRVSAASSVSSTSLLSTSTTSPSAAYQSRRPPLASSTSTSSSSYSYYKPIRLRERPLLTQISRQLNTRYTPSSPSSRLPSVRQGDDARATQYTQPLGGATSSARQLYSSASSASLQHQHQVPARTPTPTLPTSKSRDEESEREKEAKWAADVARNISRNKYLIKFREFDKRPSIGDEQALRQSHAQSGVALPRPDDLLPPSPSTTTLVDEPPATPTVTAPTPPALESASGGQRILGAAEQVDPQLLEPPPPSQLRSSSGSLLTDSKTSSNNSNSSSSSSSSGSSPFNGSNSNSSSSRDPQFVEQQSKVSKERTNFEQSRVANEHNDDNVDYGKSERDKQVKVETSEIGEQKHQGSSAEGEGLAEQQEQRVGLVCVGVESRRVEEAKVEAAAAEEGAAKVAVKKQANAATKKRVLVKKKADLKEKLVAEEAAATGATGKLVVDKQAMLDKTIERRIVDKRAKEEPPAKLAAAAAAAAAAAPTLLLPGEASKPPAEQKVVKASALEPAISATGANKEITLVEKNKMKEAQVHCDKKAPTEVAAAAKVPQTPPKSPPPPEVKPAPSALKQVPPTQALNVNGTGEAKKAPAERVIRLRLKAGATTGVCAPLKQTNRAPKIGRVEPSGRIAAKVEQQQAPEQQAAAAVPAAAAAAPKEQQPAKSNEAAPAPVSPVEPLKSRNIPPEPKPKPIDKAPQPTERKLPPPQPPLPQELKPAAASRTEPEPISEAPSSGATVGAELKKSAPKEEAPTKVMKAPPKAAPTSKANSTVTATATATTAPTNEAPAAKPKVKKLVIKRKVKVDSNANANANADEETPQEKPATRRRESNASSGAGSPKKVKTKIKLTGEREALSERQLEENNVGEMTTNKKKTKSNKKKDSVGGVDSDLVQKMSTKTSSTDETTGDGGNNKKKQQQQQQQIEAPMTPKTPETPTSIGDGLSPLSRQPNKRIKFRAYNIDDFNFLSVLGHGGWGFVILAELKEHDACFAVKCIKKITIVEDDDFDSIMIERKMLTLGNINPFICKLFCTFETDGYLFFVMEYCAGGDLMFHVQREGKFSEPRCRFYAAEIICAIRFLHNRHIIYRDLKLDNILLDSSGHVRLVDFGMCQCRTYREEMLPSNFCGTPEYISPEIIKGVPYNHSVDWWSFGVLLYEMAVGKMPFRGNDENELLWNVCYEQIHYPMFLTKELTTLLQSLLEREPTKRMGMATCKAGDIYDQPWFRGVDWRATEEMRVKPPFVPEVTSNRDVRNFDDDFTQSAPELSPIDEDTLQRIDQSQFQKFPYTNPDIFIFN